MLETILLVCYLKVNIQSTHNWKKRDFIVLMKVSSDLIVVANKNWVN